MEVKPYWFFIGGLAFLFVFLMLVVPGRRHHWRPQPSPWLGPGGTRRMFGSSSSDMAEYFDTGAKFFMFGVDWCPHCVKAKPIFESLGSTATIAGQPVSFQYVNPEQQKEAAAGFEIEGYPTFYLVRGSQKLKYTGPRTADGFRAFLEQNLSSA